MQCHIRRRNNQVMKRPGDRTGNRAPESRTWARDEGRGANVYWFGRLYFGAEKLNVNHLQLKVN